MKNKLIFFDIDGTLISYKNETHIPEKTIEAIKLLHENGHTIAFASARSLCLTQSLMDELMIFNAVLHNGAQIILNNKSVYENKIDENISNRICNALINTDNSVFAFDNQFIYTHNITNEARIYIEEQAGRKDVIKPLSEATCDLLAITVYGDVVASELIGDHAALITGKGVSKIMPLNTSKGSAILRTAQLLNFPITETLAFGDNINDIDMLKSVGIGIAVGNANDQVKASANIITDNIEDGGIFKILKELTVI